MGDNSNRIKDTTPLLDSEQANVVSPQVMPEPEASDAISPEEAAEFREQKLAGIRQAINAGAYDSDELLQHGMQKMRAAIEDGDLPQ